MTERMQKGKNTISLTSRLYTVIFPPFPASLTRQHINPVAQIDFYLPRSRDSFLGCPHPCVLFPCYCSAITPTVLEETQALVLRSSARGTLRGRTHCMGSLCCTAWEWLWVALNKGETVFLKCHSPHVLLMCYCLFSQGI